jgi:hypothetical protein
VEFKAQNAALIELNIQREERDIMNAQEEEEREVQERLERAKDMRLEEELERQEKVKHDKEILELLAKGNTKSAERLVAKVRATAAKATTRAECGSQCRYARTTQTTRGARSDTGSAAQTVLGRYICVRGQVRSPARLCRLGERGYTWTPGEGFESWWISPGRRLGTGDPLRCIRVGDSSSGGTAYLMSE